MAEDKKKPSGANQYSVYSQRDTESTQVDWSNIAKSLTDDLQKVADEREKKKAEIEQGTADALAKLSEIEDINDNDLTQVIIDGSDNGKQTLIQAADLLSRGLMTLKDFQLIKQQLLNGYSNISKYVKNYDKALEEGNQRMLEDIASDLEIAFNEGTFGAADLKNKRLISNPKTGQLALVTMVQNDKGEFVLPDPTKNPEKYKSADYLAKRQQFRLDKTDYNKEAQEAVDGLGTYIDSAISEYNVFSGGAAITKIEDFRQAFEMTKPTNEDGTPMTYKQFYNDQVNAIAGAEGDKTSFKAAQILSKLGYRAVESEAEAKEKGYSKYYLYKASNGKPVPQLTDEELTIARDAAGRSFEAALTRKITKQQPLSGQQATSATLGDRDKDKKISGYIEDINVILSGGTDSAQRIKTLTTAINEQRKAYNPPQPIITDIDIDDDKMVITYESGPPTTLDRQTKDDAGVVTSTTSYAEDVGNLYQFLVPGAQGVGGIYNLSPSDVERFIGENNIKLGQKGLGNVISFGLEVAQPESITLESQVLKADGTPQSGSDYWRDTDLKNNIGTGGADSDRQIARVSNEYFEDYTTPSAATARRRAGIDNVRVEVSGNPSAGNRKAVLKYTEDGAEKLLEVTDIPFRMSIGDYGRAMTKALNEINTIAYNKATGTVTPDTTSTETETTTDVTDLSPKVEDFIKENGKFPDIHVWTKTLVDDDFKKQYSNRELQDIYRKKRDAFEAKK
jgi:hypothetical protein